MRYFFPKPTADNYRKRYNAVFSRLPDEIATPILRFLSCKHFSRLSEIRLHDGGNMMLILDGDNHILSEPCSSRALRETVLRLCDGSIYAHEDTILDGYIGCAGGIRAGLCGRAILQGGKICGLDDISGVNIRVPNRVRGAENVLYRLLCEHRFRTGVLLYAAPGVGKTTVLRELYYRLCDQMPPLRFAVIDARGELTACLDEARPQNAPDVFLGYPKGIGIELATRVMSAQLILCDEIGSREEADAILLAQNSGVPLIASAHADSYEELLKKPYIARLLRAGVFRFAIGITRKEGERQLHFDIREVSENIAYG